MVQDKSSKWHCRDYLIYLPSQRGPVSQARAASAVQTNVEGREKYTPKVSKFLYRYGCRYVNLIEISKLVRKLMYISYSQGLYS